MISGNLIAAPAGKQAHISRKRAVAISCFIKIGLFMAVGINDWLKRDFDI